MPRQRQRLVVGPRPPMRLPGGPVRTPPSRVGLGRAGARPGSTGAPQRGQSPSTVTVDGERKRSHPAHHGMDPFQQPSRTETYPPKTPQGPTGPRHLSAATSGGRHGNGDPPAPHGYEIELARDAQPMGSSNAGRARRSAGRVRVAASDTPVDHVRPDRVLRCVPELVSGHRRRACRSPDRVGRSHAHELRNRRRHRGGDLAAHAALVGAGRAVGLPRNSQGLPESGGFTSCAAHCISYPWDSTTRTFNTVVARR